MFKEVDRVEVLERLAQHEEMVEQLYRNFAKKFPEAKELLLPIAQEESGHAGVLRDLKEQYLAGKIQLTDDRFKSRAILFSIDNIYDLIKHAQDGNITQLKDALNSKTPSSSKRFSRFLKTIPRN